MFFEQLTLAAEYTPEWGRLKLGIPKGWYNHSRRRKPSLEFVTFQVHLQGLKYSMYSINICKQAVTSSYVQNGSIREREQLRVHIYISHLRASRQPFPQDTTSQCWLAAHIELFHKSFIMPMFLVWQKSHIHGFILNSYKKELSNQMMFFPSSYVNKVNHLLQS